MVELHRSTKNRKGFYVRMKFFRTRNPKPEKPFCFRYFKWLLWFSLSFYFFAKFLNNHEPSTNSLKKTIISHTQSNVVSRALSESVPQQPRINQGLHLIIWLISFCRVDLIRFDKFWFDLQVCWRIWRCMYTNYPRNTTAIGYQTNGVTIIYLLRRWRFIKRWWKAMFGRLTHRRLISSSSLFTFPATSAPLMAFPPSDTLVLFYPPPLSSSHRSYHSGNEAMDPTMSSLPHTIMGLVSMPW